MKQIVKSFYVSVAVYVIMAEMRVYGSAAWNNTDNSYN